MESRFVTVEYIAKDLDVKETTVRQWIKDKKLPAIRAGKQFRILRTDYEKFLEQHRTDKTED